MILPFRRDALRERERFDEADEAESFARTTPSDRLLLSVELSDMARALAESVGSAWVSEAGMSLEDKARLFVAPLKAAAP